MKFPGGAPIRLAAASLLGATLAIAAPVAAAAAPATSQKASPTTTTTTKPGTAAAFAKLVIKADSVGHVKVEAAGTSTFKPAKNGQSLHIGDTVQTDASGQAEIDYADTAYTRLDVNTTFTIKKLTDSQGNRQVEGSLDVGRTYNRTAALTQSQTFQQDAGGATAAVAGTAFVVTCTSATSCTFTAVIDNINLTGPGGQIKNLNPLDECVDNNGALCGTTTRLTSDEVALIGWITQNVLADLTEHGIGNGVFQPFAGTVVVNNAVVQSFTPATPNQGFQPQTPPPPPPPPPPPSPPVIDPNNPMLYVSGGDNGPFPAVPNQVHSCSPNVSQCQAINIGDDNTPFVFQINASDPNSPANPFNIVFTNLNNINNPSGTNSTGNLYITAPTNLVVINHPYIPTTQFTFAPREPSPTPATGSFTVQAVNQAAPTIASQPTTINVTVPTN
jgi:FecR protein